MRIHSQDKFELPAAQGLMPGEYKVAISSPKETPVSEADYAAGKMPLAAEDLLPAKYNTATTLTANVSAAGDNRFEWKLE